MLTPKQEAFCMAYVKCGNATQAYKDAGYSVNNDATMRVNASRLLTNANVQKRLQEIRQKVEDDKIMTLKEQQQFLSSVVRQDVEDANGKMPRYSDRLKAVELLMRSQGGFAPDKVELTQMPVVLHDDVSEDS